MFIVLFSPPPPPHHHLSPLVDVVLYLPRTNMINITGTSRSSPHGGVVTHKRHRKHAHQGHDDEPCMETKYICSSVLMLLVNKSSRCHPNPNRIYKMKYSFPRYICICILCVNPF